MFCSLGVAPILKTESDDDQINKKIQEKLFELFTNSDAQQKAIFNRKTRPLLILFNRKRDI